MSLFAFHFVLAMGLTDPVPSEPIIGPCTQASVAIESADRNAVRQIMADVAADPSEGHMALLEELLIRHEDTHRLERCGDVIHVNSGEPEDGLFVQADMVGTITKATASQIRVDVRRSYLLDAATQAFSIRYRQGDVERARRWLALGLKINPREPALQSFAQKLSH